MHVHVHKINGCDVMLHRSCFGLEMLRCISCEATYMHETPIPPGTQGVQYCDVLSPGLLVSECMTGDNSCMIYYDPPLRCSFMRDVEAPSWVEGGRSQACM